MRALFPVLAAMLFGACATTPAPRGPDRAAVARVVAMAAGQVQRCYRSPRIPGEGRRITVVLRVRYSADGALAGFPTLIEQRGVTPENQLYARRMVEAAMLAVMRCSPINLPAELYQGGWDEFDLTFSPRAVA
jgi:hypothetical protein